MKIKDTGLLPEIERAHTYASENADDYILYDSGQEDYQKRVGNIDLKLDKMKVRSDLLANSDSFYAYLEGKISFGKLREILAVSLVSAFDSGSLLMEIEELKGKLQTEKRDWELTNELLKDRIDELEEEIKIRSEGGVE